MEFTPAIIPAILVITGIFGVYISLAKITFREITICSLGKNATVVGVFGCALLIFGLISGAMGIFDPQTVTSTVKPIDTTPEPPTVTPEININYPLNKSTVKIQENVQGTAKNIPEGDEIWIFVHPDGVDKYYPQRSSAVIQNGKWSLNVDIGSKDDAGRKFEIIAVLADKKAQEEINSYFVECEKTGKWPGMDKIPDSAKECNRITVTRLPVPPEIKITYPLNGSQVDITVDVKGTQKNIPSDKALWIVVLPHKTYNYHPVKEVYIQDNASDFSVPAIPIGGLENKTESFDIIAVLADKQAQKAFTDYLNTSAITKIYPGIDRPEGTEEKSRVTVIRK